MKVDKNKGTEENRQANDKDAIRKKIWEHPALIGKLFSDQSWQEFNADETAHDVPGEEMLDHIRMEIDRQARDRELRVLRKQRVLKIVRYTGAAAAAALLVISLGLWQIKTSDTAHPTAKLQPVETTSGIQDPLWSVIENNAENVRTVTLPDGSTVGLFAQSSIRYLKEFTASSREIQLRGKAFFEVRKDPSRPFSVYAGGTRTTALGTSFTIDTRAQAYKTTVRLHTGKVVVASANMTAAFKDVYLSQKGESFIFDSYTHRAELVKVATGQTTKTTRVTNIQLSEITNIPLDEVIGALADAYKVKINTGTTSLANIQYTGSIDTAHETIEEALTLICLINDLHYVVEKDGSYTIYTANSNKSKIK
jgi:transmembrane sensor